MILITGFPRSGTGYTAKALQVAGLDIGHETHGRAGIVSWLHCASGETSYTGPVEPLEYDVIYHQVRNPMDAIASAITLRDESYQYMFDVIGHPGGERGLRWAMWAWLKWNEYIETLNPAHRFKVEAFDYDFLPLLGIFNIPDVPKSTNSRYHAKLLIEDMRRTDPALFEEIKSKAEEYGYELKDPPIPSISIIMMVKNEEKYLAQCLESVKDIADEIVIVDTGSTDRTIEIATSYGAKVYHHPWENNFSLHRNQSVSYATKDWLIQIDADEKLFPDRLLKMLQVMPENINGCSVRFRDMQKGQVVVEFNNTRIFRRGCIEYKGIVHNEPHVKDEAVAFLDGPYFEHYGYDASPETMKKKHERTVGLLKKRIEADELDTKAYFYLMQSLGSQQQLKEALEYGEKYIKLREHDSNFNNSVYFTVIQLCISLGHLDKAEAYIAEALHTLPNDLDISQAVAEFGMAANRPDLIADGSRRFLRAYDRLQKNKSLSGHRFVYCNNVGKLSLALYNVAMAGLSEGTQALERLRQLMPNIKGEPHYERMQKNLEKSLADMGVSWIEGAENGV